MSSSFTSKRLSAFFLNLRTKLCKEAKILTTVHVINLTTTQTIIYSL